MQLRKKTWGSVSDVWHYNVCNLLCWPLTNMALTWFSIGFSKFLLRKEHLWVMRLPWGPLCCGMLVTPSMLGVIACLHHFIVMVQKCSFTFRQRCAEMSSARASSVSLFLLSAQIHLPRSLQDPAACRTFQFINMYNKYPRLSRIGQGRMKAKTWHGRN